MEIKILLICGGGASTSFLAQKMRKVASAKGINAEIEARSDSQLASMVNEVDVVLVGPHLKHQEPKIKEICSSAGNKPYAFIDPMVYGMLDGEKALEAALKMKTKNADEENNNT